VVLKDAFNAVLVIAKELTGDPAVKQSISDDLALVESKAAEGIEALEAHVADWFAKHYALPAPESTPASAQPAPVTAPDPVAASTFATAEASLPQDASGL
jgi:hypothetical protein